MRVNAICPGFVRTPLLKKHIPEQARALGIREQDVLRNVMLKEHALTGQSILVSGGWFMH